MASATGESPRLRDALDLRLFVDGIPTLAWSSRPDGSMDFANHRWNEYTGLSLEESCGWAWKTAIHPEDLPRLGSAWESPQDNDFADSCEVRLRRSDGVFRWFSFRREPLRDETGVVTRWYGTGTDIDGAKQKETLHAAEKRTLEMIADGASLFEVLNELCAVIDVHTSATCLVFLVDREGNQLLPLAGPHLPSAVAAAFTPWPIGPNSGSCGTAAFTKERVIMPDIAADSRWSHDNRCLAAQRLVLDHGFHAAWSEPLISNGGDVLGTFCIAYSRSRSPDDRDLELIEGVGHIARIAIERQQSHEALRIALATIKNSESKLRQVIDTIPTLAWCNSPDGPNEFLNKRWHEYTGRSHEESTGWGWQAAFHPEDVPPLMKKWRELLASGESGEIEARLRRHDGVYRWFLIRVEPFRDEQGKLLRWYGTSTDIDALKQTQEKLREDERELRRITDAIPQTIVVLDPSGSPLYANQATLDYAGLSAEDLVVPRFRERLFHSDDLERFREERKAALGRGVPFEAELRARRKDGAYRWFLIRYNPFRNEQGQLTRWYATGTDIDDRVRAEERTRNENLALREQIDRDSMFEEIVGSSKALCEVLAQVSKVAPTDSTVLILGETGTGKELIARAIHRRSKRANRAFIRVNCAAIPPPLIASELFGHEKGSFTGALQRRLGRFESADGGTIFLDEIGELPPETQIALLRVLQEREFERVGGNRTIPIDVRVLTATNEDLSAAVAEGAFRRDLFYRLNVFPIQMPALRDRVDDIPVLLEYMVDRYAQRAGKKFRSITKNTLDLFQSYHWPGNIRELQNVVERAVILSDGEIFHVDPSWLMAVALEPAPPSVSLAAGVSEREKAIIEKALRDAQGVVSGPMGAAAKLGLPRQTLEAKIKKQGIDRFRFRTR